MQIPLERARAIERVAALVDNILLRRVGHVHLELPCCEPLAKVSNQQVDNLDQIRLCQRAIEYNLVQAVEEFRAERLLKHLQHEVSCPVCDAAVAVDPLQNHIRSQIAGQDQDGVLEVHRPALPVRNAPVVEHLQEHVEHVGMRFFHLVK